MKLVLALTLSLCVLAAATVHLPSSALNENHMLFSAFMKQHGKRYQSHVEFNRRFNAFNQNLAHVKKHNEEAAAGKHTYTLAMNHLADMTNEEYRHMLKTRASSPTSPAHKFRGVFRPETVGSLPDTVDWRTKNVVTKVKNQGQCGSCWSFSATGSMEGAHALATGSLVAFSEQNLVDCVDNGACTCDAGGEMQDGFAYAIQNGIEGELDYPYCACSKGVCHFNSSKVRAHFSSYQNITSGDESALQAAVAARPGVSIAIDASSLQFQLYGGGVFNDPSCKNGINDLDHGVLIVGYGTQGSDYWLVKNSWGESWGLSGYIMMSRNANNQCGIATDASFVLV